MEKMIAQADLPYTFPGRIVGEGEWADPGNEATALLTDIITTIVGLMTLIAGVFFFFILLSGAIGWISSGGDRQKIESAKQRVFNGVIGMVIVVAAIFIIQFAGGVIGFPDILNPESTISRLYSGGTVEPAAWVICRGDDMGCDQVCSPSRGWGGCSNECTGSFCSVPSGTYLYYANSPPPSECQGCRNFQTSCGTLGPNAIFCCCRW